MFRIRKIYDTVLPANRMAVEQVQHILRMQFPGLSEEKIATIPDQLTNPLKYRFRSILFVAEDSKRNVRGFALVSHAPDLNFCLLDYIATGRKAMGRGIGGALYARVREETESLKSVGLFFEVLPDDPKLSRDPEVRRQNRARLRFYERYGARPIVNTKYEAPLTPGGDNPPYLVFDPLGREAGLRPGRAKKIVGAILERKYADECPHDYVQMVVDSFRDDPVRLRPPRYTQSEPTTEIKRKIPEDKKILLVVNEKHIIHHVRVRGYVESPVRVAAILGEIEKTGLFLRVAPARFSETHLRQVHDSKFLNYLKKLSQRLEPDRSIYPYVFPIRNETRPPKELAVRAGYYCIDTFTPINRNAYLAARGAVYCTLTAARSILEGHRLAYALVRPPGHHAEHRSFGGFCYLNSAAIAAHYLSRHGRVAMLDIDYHHGNGQQDIFYNRPDVLTISIHGHPNFAYPYFSGFRDEKGRDEGRGYNVNFPLPENTTGDQYRGVLSKALKLIERFRPEFLIVLLGLDTAKGDPTGTWNLIGRDFRSNGRMIGRLMLPTLVVQEGGYNSRVIGSNVRNFFAGLWTGAYS